MVGLESDAPRGCNLVQVEPVWLCSALLLQLPYYHATDYCDTAA